MCDTQNKAPLIGALRKTTLVDFPEHVASVLFLHGCNLRCPYCYNKDLVTGNFSDYEAVSIHDVTQHLEKRRNVISGFVISGGEPCISKHLENLIELAHNLGYLVKLDTNGTHPEKLSELLKNPILIPDFIALDIKTSMPKYNLCGTENTDSIIESIEILKTIPTNKREFRTVLVPELVTKADVMEIAKLLPSDAKWRFAQFLPENCLNPQYNNITPYTDEEIAGIVKEVQPIIFDAKLR